MNGNLRQQEELTLGQKQKLFAQLIGVLLVWAYANKYEITFGEAWRPDITAAAYAKQGKGIKSSLHKIRLAFDMNLFINGVYQTDSAAYKPLGDYWKTLHSLCRWGGDFSKPDGNHFSIEHEGIK